MRALLNASNLNGFNVPAAVDIPAQYDTTQAGKLIQVDDGDINNNGVPDFADGFINDPNLPQSPETLTTAQNQNFVPIVLSISPNIDISTAAFSIHYNAANPMNASVLGGAGTVASPYQYSAGAGDLRLWTHPDSYFRDATNFALAPAGDPDGFYVAPNSSGGVYPAGDLAMLGFSNTIRSVTLWAEGIASTTGPIAVNFTVYVGGDVTKAVHDSALVTVYPGLVRVDANRDNKIVFGANDLPAGTAWNSSLSDRTSVANPDTIWLNNNSDNDATGKTADYSYSTVGSTADLEDWFPLVIQVPPAYTQGWSMRLALQDEPGMTGSLGDMSIKVLRVTQSQELGYLTSPTVDQGLLNQAINYGVGPDAGSVGTHWAAGLNLVPNEKLYFLVEGVHKGQGQLVVKFLNNFGQNIAAQDVIDLKIQDIKNFYEDWSIGQSPTIATPGSPITIGFDTDQLVNNNFPSDPGTLVMPSVVNLTTDSSPLSNRSDYTNDYILYVHGWNEDPTYRRTTASTAYKRLYWQGFKGRFGMFNWPTGSGVIGNFTPSGLWNALVNRENFDNSSYVALASGQALLTLIKQLDGNGYTVNIIGHSLGNLVVGEALRDAANSNLGDVVNTYIAAQAAVPADAYSSALDGSFYAAHSNLANDDSANMWSKGFKSVQIAGNPTGGSFSLEFGGDSTGPIPYNADANSVLTALETISGSNWNISVVGPANGTYGITFYDNDPGDYTQKPPILAVANSSLVGGISPSVTVSSSSYFGMIGSAATKSYNFYNPDDGAVNAILGWLSDQYFKPASQYSVNTVNGVGGASAGVMFYGPSGALNTLTPSGMWQILSYASDAYAMGLGASANVGAPFTTAGQVDLEHSLPAGSTFNATRHDHSAEFYYDNEFTQYFWNLVMKRMGLLNAANWPDLTPTLGFRP